MKAYAIELLRTDRKPYKTRRFVEYYMEDGIEWRFGTHGGNMCISPRSINICLGELLWHAKRGYVGWPDTYKQRDGMMTDEIEKRGDQIRPNRFRVIEVTIGGPTECPPWTDPRHKERATSKGANTGQRALPGLASCLPPAQSPRKE